MANRTVLHVVAEEHAVESHRSLLGHASGGNVGNRTAVYSNLSGVALHCDPLRHDKLYAAISDMNYSIPWLDRHPESG